MTFRIDIDISEISEGLDVLETELDRNVAQAFRTGLQMITETARRLAPQDTSALKESIQPLGPTGSFVAGTLEGEVFAGAPYALPVEEGARAHEIRPRFRRALRFPVAGGFAFARVVRHPGNKPQPFLGPALEENEADIEAEIGAAVELSIHRAGF